MSATNMNTNQEDDSLLQDKFPIDTYPILSITTFTSFTLSTIYLPRMCCPC